MNPPRPDRRIVPSKWFLSNLLGEQPVDHRFGLPIGALADMPVAEHSSLIDLLPCRLGRFVPLLPCRLDDDTSDLDADCQFRLFKRPSID
jgi:hypothetical protein